MNMMNKCAKFMEIFQAVKKKNSISRTRLNFRETAGIVYAFV